MPVDVHRVDDIAAAVASVYREGETALLRAITERLDAGLDATDWQQRKLAELVELRRAASLISTSMSYTGSSEIRRAVAVGYRSGRHDAVAELAGVLFPSTRAPRHTGPAAQTGAKAAQALADAAVREVRPLHSAILPQAVSVYRKAVAGAAARKLTAATTQREAAQAAWSAITREGITGYTDTAGRRWRLHTWVEMATRTTVMRAAVHGLVDGFRASGVRLVSVDDQAGECVLCRPFEHRVLALWGPTGTVQEPAARTDGEVEVDVECTLDEAMQRGLFHPNCRHTIRAYLPGTSLLIKRDKTADPAGDDARQRQREIERALRWWREQAAAALTGQARRRADAKVADWDRLMTAHIAETGLTRLRYREQIGAGHVPPPGRVDDVATLLGIPDQPAMF
jgi:Phage minor capsid protein 2